MPFGFGEGGACGSRKPDISELSRVVISGDLQYYCNEGNPASTGTTLAATAYGIVYLNRPHSLLDTSC